MSTETFKKLPLHEAIVLLKNGQSLADISRRAGHDDRWLQNTLYCIKKNQRIAKTTLKKLYEALPALPAIAEPYPHVGKRVDLAASRRNMAKARAARQAKTSKGTAGDKLKMAGELGKKLFEIQTRFGADVAASVASVLSSWGMK